MLHIGIVDITTVGSAICQLAIANQNDSGDHPEFSVHSSSFKLYKEHVASSNWAGIADLVLSSIDRLSMAGADFIIIPSNTPHYAYDEICAGSPLPVLNLIDITVEECCTRGFSRVAVLGTIQTMEGGLYSVPLMKKGITPVIPEDDLRNKINDLIYNIIKKQAGEKEVEEVAQQLRELDCDAFILGCTELPDVYNDQVLEKSCVDTTRLLATKALEYAN